MNGLGLLTSDPMPVTLSTNGPANVQVAVPGAQAAAKPSIWDNISNVINKASEIATKIQPAIKNAQQTVQLYQQGYMPPNNNQPPPPAPGMSNGVKVALGVGAAAVVGGLLYAATR